MSYDAENEPVDPQTIKLEALNDFNEQLLTAKQSTTALALALQHQSLTASENADAAERFFEFICQRPEPEARCPPRDKIFGVNIEEEYALIKQKKSKLSRKMRDLVIERKEHDESK